MATITYTCCKESNSCTKLGNQKKALSELANELGYQVIGQISENLQAADTSEMTPGIQELIKRIETEDIDTVILDIQDFEHSKESVIQLCDTCIRNDVSMNQVSDLHQDIMYINEAKLQLQ